MFEREEEGAQIATNASMCDGSLNRWTRIGPILPPCLPGDRLPFPDQVSPAVKMPVGMINMSAYQGIVLRELSLRLYRGVQRVCTDRADGLHNERPGYTMSNKIQFQNHL